MVWPEDKRWISRQWWFGSCYVRKNGALKLFLAGIVIVSVPLWLIYYKSAGDPDTWLESMAVEGFGFLADVLLFGIVWSIFERRREITNLQKQLTAFLRWESEEGVVRKVGIIRELNDLRAPLPNMQFAYLRDAKLSGARLEGARLFGAYLEGADLSEAYLESADLERANLQGARLWRTNLGGASFHAGPGGALGLEVALISGANLEGAELWGANVEGVDFEGVRLAGADFNRAIGLTWDQLRCAITDKKTVLPSYLRADKPGSYEGKFGKPEEERLL